jgi:hypothetical protein
MILSSELVVRIANEFYKNCAIARFLFTKNENMLLLLKLD